jgi:mutator protein MutT
VLVTQSIVRSVAEWRGELFVNCIVVTAAVIDRDGRFLVTRRQEGVHLAGCWEFPGGKCEAGESLDACLARELREELDVEVQVGGEIFTTTHDYADRRVELHFLRCDLHGNPQPQLGQEMRWVRGEELAALEFPPADAELIRLLRER